ncbi:aminoglycoside phosphotransferase family protein [Pseudonocardia kujensis]|uniref:aminoglycoside phosphotransferase family protein n=1 Tax=Pseudonocardia kujensis TaxID=1128675 RepID=UPI001E60342B|nr:aminoglycoside phosphotransferase family protein [Pseudonocardia kujensis]MCE0765377.1 aminoglycoside phosphotransferase family protein [Pseudonocardia kujensis]
MDEQAARALSLRLDPAVKLRLAARFGESVGSWLDDLPGRLQELEEAWGLDLEEVSAGGTSVVFRGSRAGAPVVVKLCPDAEIGRWEADALRCWAGLPHVVELLAADEADGALLLAGVSPGTPLVEDDWQLVEVAPLLSDLTSSVKVPSVHVPSLVERVEFLFGLTRRRIEAGGDQLVGPQTLDEAERLAVALASDPEPPARLVHGDLHPGNVLRGRGGSVVAIDPRACLGDSHFDAIDWVLRGEAPTRAGVLRAAEELAQLVPCFDAERITAWVVALAPVLAISQAGAGSDAAQRRARCLISLWDEATLG